ncbi:GAF and ANTAR domain-containing protein [Amycolatopsis sp. NPDC004368]
MPRFADLDQALALVGERSAATSHDGDQVTDRDQVTDGELDAQFETLTRTLLTATTAAAALRQIVDATLVLVPGADLVSVTLRTPDGGFSTPVSTDPAAAGLDQVQYRSGEGPCVDAALPDAPGYVTSTDLNTERRWPDFAAATTARGYQAVLSTELFAAGDKPQPTGALNIYSRRPRLFTAADRHAALLLTTHASLTLARTRAVELADLHEHHLLQAIDTRDVIGQAKGILMNRQNITAEEAFAVLRRTSQDLNVKLVELAHTLADRHHDLDRP